MAGTFSDGYRDPNATILKKAKELQIDKAKLAERQKSLRTAQERLQSMIPMNKEYTRCYP